MARQLYQRVGGSDYEYDDRAAYVDSGYNNWNIMSSSYYFTAADYNFFHGDSAYNIRRYFKANTLSWWTSIAGYSSLTTNVTIGADSSNLMPFICSSFKLPEYPWTNVSDFSGYCYYGAYASTSTAYITLKYSSLNDCVDIYQGGTKRASRPGRGAYVLLSGGGGGGAGAVTATIFNITWSSVTGLRCAGGGGGGGASALFYIDVYSSGDAAITIGTGGSGGAVVRTGLTEDDGYHTGNDGSAGSASTIDTEAEAYCRVSGGSGGRSANFYTDFVGASYDIISMGLGGAGGSTVTSSRKRSVLNFTNFAVVQVVGGGTVDGADRQNAGSSGSRVSGNFTFSAFTRSIAGHYGTRGIAGAASMSGNSSETAHGGGGGGCALLYSGYSSMGGAGGRVTQTIAQSGSQGNGGVAIIL